MSPRTRLHANPFCVLGITTRDDGRKIIEMAEEHSLSIDPDDCQKAHSALTNPRTRLSAEIAWMPGVPPRTADSMVSALSQDPTSVRRGAGLPELARANVMAAALELVEEGEPASSVAQLIDDFAKVVESVDSSKVLRDINEDRTISGFPEVQGIDAVEDALAERRKAYPSVLRNVLDKMETEKLIETMSIAVSLATSHGDKHGPAFLDDLVDNTYEVEAQIFLQPEHENIVELLRRAKEAAPRGAGALAPLLDRLDRVVKNWDRVAQPIQISAKSRGVAHRQSRDIALVLRNFGVDLVNDHRMFDESSRVIKLIQETFSELPEVAERLEDDVRTIGQLRSERDQWGSPAFQVGSLRSNLPAMR